MCLQNFKSHLESLLLSKQTDMRQVLWHIPILLVLRSLKQEDYCDFKGALGYK